MRPEDAQEGSRAANAALPVVSPKVVIVILNWNGLTDTLECLRSVSNLEYANFAVVVVDNGSDHMEADRIEECGCAGTVVRLPANLGYAEGCNVGMRQAVEQDAGYVWLLNNDVVVPPDCLTKLVAVGEESGRLGLLSPVVYEYARQGSVQSAGTMVDLARETQMPLRSLDDPASRDGAGALTLLGTALLIKRSVIDRIGFFDPRYFAYQEDTDYTFRGVVAGFDTRVVREASVFHKYGRSLGGRDAPAREYLFTRNFYLFWRTHLKGWRRLSYPARYASWVLGRVLDARQCGRSVIAEYMLSGGWDALRGHWGSWEQRGKVPPIVEGLLNRWVLGWHPYFWIQLLAGNIGSVSAELVRRLWKREDRRV